MGDSPKDRKGRDRDRPRRDRGGGGRMEMSRDRSNDNRGGGGREPRSMRSSQNRVFLSNIPYEYRWQDIKDLFRTKVGDVVFVELFVDDNDKPKGSGIVEFSDHDAVMKCLEVMQRHEVKGRKLVVKDDGGISRDKNGSIIGSGGRRNRDSDRFRDDHRGGDLGNNMSMRNDDSKWGNTYGLSPQFLESLKIDPPLNNKVFVANLDYNIDQKKLKDVFRLAGRVISVDLPLDKDGKVRGFAVIEYDHPVEAVQAISMLQGQVLNERTLAVRMDRVNESMKLPDGLRSIGMGLGPNGEPLKNVAHNLPSLGGGNTNSSGGVGSGILGAVPNNSLQLANALSGLGGVGNLANLNSLQSSNFSGLANTLLGNGLGATDLSSLVQNPLAAQNSATQQQLVALAAQNNASNTMGFNRPAGGGDNSYGNLQSQNVGQNSYSNNLGGGRNYPGGGGGNNAGGGNFGNNFSNNNGSGYNRDRQDGNTGGKSFSKKIMVSNLPPTASYKLLNEKFSEFGDVQGFEEKNHGSVLVTYGSDWQAERAIKNLDKARIDGRMIDARLYF